MGLAWGPSKDMNDTIGQGYELGRLYRDQMTPWLGRSQDAANTSRDLYGNIINYNVNRVNNGMATPEQIRETGKRVMPGLDELLAARKARQQSIEDQWAAVPKAGQTMDQINENLNTQAENISRLSDQTNESLTDWTGRAMTREDQAYNDIVNNIRDTQTGQSNLVDTTYGDLRGQNKATIQELLQEAEMLKPGGEFAVARTARQFAPVVSKTAAALRRSGIDPNSPEGLAAMQRVGGLRGRAMDEAAAAGTEKYLKTRSDLKQTGFGNEAALATHQAALQLGISDKAASLFQQQIAKTTGNKQKIDASSVQQTIKNMTDTFDRTTKWLADKNNAVMLDRALRMEDWKTTAALLKDANAEDLLGLDLQNLEFDRGLQQTVRDMVERQGGIDQLLTIARDQFRESIDGANQALSFGNASQRSSQWSYGEEAKNAGWLSKLFSGVGMKGLDLLLKRFPGMGAPGRGSANGIDNFWDKPGYQSLFGGSQDMQTVNNPWGEP